MNMYEETETRVRVLGVVDRVIYNIFIRNS